MKPRIGEDQYHARSGEDEGEKEDYAYKLDILPYESKECAIQRVHLGASIYIGSSSATAPLVVTAICQSGWCSPSSGADSRSNPSFIGLPFFRLSPILEGRTMGFSGSPPGRSPTAMSMGARSGLVVTTDDEGAIALIGEGYMMCAAGLLRAVSLSGICAGL